MSKHSPSSTISVPSASATRGVSQSLARWRRRVFRNTFTRRGRRFRVRGWAFKVQFQGRRRSFSLSGRSRTAAAAEAQRLQRELEASGWEAAISLNERQRQVDRGRPRPAERTARLSHLPLQWEQRLIQRRYHEARLVSGPEYSARIEHEGTFAYFPLGSADPKQAAREAAAIHQTIASFGWQTAFGHYSREITMAIFWCDNPVAVTYTTLYTFVGDAQPSARTGPAHRNGSKSVAVIEPDPTVLSCVRFWLDRQPGFGCPAACRNGDELLQGTDLSQTSLVLINRSAPESGRLFDSLKARCPGMPVYPYQIHEESDQIFMSISGVSGGYVLKRRQPEALFDPLHPAVQARALSAPEASRHIRHYFQSFFNQTEPQVGLGATESLTPREQEILNHIGKGYLDKEIADNFNLSIWTVRNHVKRIYEKLNLHNRAEAVLKYLQK